jgi:hypothetical protein
LSVLRWAFDAVQFGRFRCSSDAEVEVVDYSGADQGMWLGPV